MASVFKFVTWCKIHYGTSYLKIKYLALSIIQIPLCKYILCFYWSFGLNLKLIVSLINNVQYQFVDNVNKTYNFKLFLVVTEMQNWITVFKHQPSRSDTHSQQTYLNNTFRFGDYWTLDKLEQLFVWHIRNLTNPVDIDAISR